MRGHANYLPVRFCKLNNTMDAMNNNPIPKLTANTQAPLWTGRMARGTIASRSGSGSGRSSC